MQLGDEFERPRFEVHAGQVVLTTIAATELMRLTDAYDVRDLIADRGTLDRLRADEGGGRAAGGARYAAGSAAHRRAAGRAGRRKAILPVSSSRTSASS